jgi:hypothetical protein
MNNAHPQYNRLPSFVNTLPTASHTSSTVTASMEVSSGLTFLKRDECARPRKIALLSDILPLSGPLLTFSHHPASVWRSLDVVDGAERVVKHPRGEPRVGLLQRFPHSDDRREFGLIAIVEDLI